MRWDGRGKRMVAALAAAVALVGAVVVVAVVRSDRAPAVPVCATDPVRFPPINVPSPSPSHAAGLGLRLNDDGTVGGVRVGNRTLPSLSTEGGFSVRMAGGTPNLIANGGFERDSNGDGIPDGWTFSIEPSASAPAVDRSVAHSGSVSIRVSNTTRSTSGAAVAQTAVKPGTYYTLSAWTRSQDVLPTIPTAVRETTDPHSSVQVQVQQLGPGGRLESTATAYGYTDTAGWDRQFAGFRTEPDVTSVRVRALLNDGSGTAWFDDLTLSELLQPASVPVHGTVTRSPATPDLTERAALPTEGLSLTARYSPFPDHVVVNGTVTGTTTQDRGFQLTYTLPVDARGWQWGDYARLSQTIGVGTYAYLSTTSLQRASRYPWGVIYDDRSALAIGIPMSEPRISRIDYDATNGLSIAFDLGVSPSATGMGPVASFSFVIYTADPAWGFRSATARYYQLFPQSFQRRTNPACEGAWFVAPPLGSIASTYRRFGLGLDMIALGKASSQQHDTWGTRYIGWDNRRHIATTAYTHQWAFFDPLGTKKLPDYGGAITQLQGVARSTATDPESQRLRDEAAAAMASTARDYNGRLYYEQFGSFLAFYQNLDARPWTQAADREQVARAVDLARQADGTLNGIHLDSTSGMRRWGAADDYDRDHWASARIPLTFSYDSGLVVERGIFSIYDRIAELSRQVHEVAPNRILTANFNATETRTLGWVGADQIDYFGLEQGLADRAGTVQGVDAFAMVKRSLAWQRPVSTLDHVIGEGKLTAAQVDRRLQQDLFYGIFSGAFDAAIEADATGAMPAWATSSNAALWARYAPIQRELAEAGWEPVTDARSSNPDVWVERFGSVGTADLHFTLGNETDRPQSYTLTVDVGAEGALSTGGFTAIERVTGRSLQVSVASRGEVTISGVIPAGSTRVIALVQAP